MALLLEAAYTGKVSSAFSRRRIWNHDSHFLLLHAACSMDDCPRSYFQQILAEHSKQCLQTNDQGLLPLHVVLKRPISSYQQFCLQQLLETAPQAAAFRDPHGRLPMHIALAASNNPVDDDCFLSSTSNITPLTWHTSGIRELTYANPTALRVADPVSNLVPFLSAATSSEHSKECLFTTFELLLAAPEMLAAVTNKIRVNRI